jgi:Gti1/Pac2 family transcription factor
MSSGGGAGPLVPTFHGFVHNSMDGLVLFEACLSGKLHHVPRRPHDRERAQLIKSGSIFIYEENASGIKRWTDGVAWSPSRILGNFLIYRELEKPFPPGEKKRAMKRKRQSLPGEPYPRRDSDENESSEMNNPLTPPEPNGADVKTEIPSTSDQDKELERSLIGSLVDSYGFRQDGLVKKTMSISVNGISHHMVSYYKVDDVKNGLLPRPMTDPRLANIAVRPELYLKQNFRAPVEETEQYALDGQGHAYPGVMYPHMAGAYGVRPGQYIGTPQAFSMYGMSPATSTYMTPSTAASWSTPQSAGALGYGTAGYGSHYSASNLYKVPTSQAGALPMKSEDPHAATQHSYSNPYAPPYPAIPRSSTSGSTMMASSYQPPYNSRASYSSASMSSPTTNGQTQHGYASAPQYPVRSPVQNYSMHSAPNSAVGQSPHTGLKSPMTGNHGLPSTDYRSTSYGVQPTPQSTHSTSDMSGLGISNNAAYGAHQSNGQSSYSYPSSGALGAPQGASQYAS